MGDTNGKNKKKTAREIIENYNGPKVRIMEVCGTHTHEIFRLGIRKLLPEQVELISGSGSGKRCDHLYVWRSGARAGDKNEPRGSKGTGRKNPHRIFSGRC